MQLRQLSRRHFGLMAASAAAVSRYSFAAAPAITAQQVFDRLSEKAAANWPHTPPTGLIAGDASTPVRGMVTTSMATVDVLRRAAKAGANLIFTCEPTFFSMSDGRTLPSARPSGPGGGPPPQPGVSPGDPVLVAKKALIEQNGLVIYRVADNWQAGEDFSRALAAALGWSKSRVAGDAVSYSIAPRALGEVLADLRKAGAGGGMRVIGDTSYRIQRVAVLPGLRTMPELLRSLPTSDLVIVGESRDWEGPEYFSDANAAGMKKGYAQIGRVVSEDPGMQAFSKWLEAVVPGVTVHSMAASEPFWRPA